MQLQQEDPTTDDNSSLDSGDAMYDMYQPRSSKIDNKKTALRSFCDNLQYNLVFSTGFNLALKKTSGLILQNASFVTAIVLVVRRWRNGRNNLANHRLVSLKRG